MRNTKVLFVFLLILLGFFLCFGYMTGSDWRQYELLYSNLNKSNLFDDVKGYEYTYPLLQFLFKSIGLTFWEFFIFIKLICFCVTILTFEKYSQFNYSWGLLAFYAIFGLDAYIDNPMRNLIASVIFLMSYKYLITNNFLKYIVLLIVASSFHMSALFLIPIYFLRNVNLNKKLILVSLSALFFFILFQQFFLRDFLVQNLWEYNNLFTERFNVVYLHESFYEDNNSVITMGMIVHLTMFILILLKKKEIEEYRYGRLIFNLTFLYMIVYIISFSIWIFFRMRLFLFVPFCISITYLPFLYRKWYSKYFTISVILVMTFFTMLSTITGSYKYIPYTNYISFLFKNKPSFFERSNYNFMNSPYNE